MFFFFEIIPIHVCYNMYQKSKIPYMDPLGNGWFVMETTMNINHSCRYIYHTSMVLYTKNTWGYHFQLQQLLRNRPPTVG